ncbi:hypothetical protein ACF0H5_003573 [Mactra antiquata]
MENENTNHPEEKRSLKDELDETATHDEFDDSKVKFLNGKQGMDECIVEVGSDVSFTGLGKEELMKYATDPFWVRTRMILMILFWVGWVAMLVAAIVIIVVAPKCPERPSLKWYQTDIVYQINPKSFKDSQTEATQEGAGTGDLKGISSKVDYLEDLGVNAFWINSFYKSGENSYDYNDVVDHKKIDESVGTMGDFDTLRKQTKKKGMKMVVDFIPNHTGKKHEWFTKSAAKEAGYEDYYIWADGKNPDPATNPPNDWVTEYNLPAWTYDSTRKQWYYHSYLPDYPDLNLRNDEVVKELDSVLRFWLDKGVDGFAIQGLQRMVEMNDTSQSETMEGELTVDQPGNLDLVKRWRKIINSYSDKPGRERVLIAHVEANGNNTEDYYDAGIHIVLTDGLLDVDPITCDQTCLNEKLATLVGDGRWKGWMVDNEKSSRFGSKVDETLQKAWQALHLLLPGTAVVYYGDEIGMKNGGVSPGKIVDPLNALNQRSRDPYRTPMLWNSEKNAGFCAPDVTPWLPINSDDGNTVEYNNAHMVGYTTYKSFKDLAKLRQHESFQFGKTEVKLMNEDILYFTRKAEGFPGFLVAINRGGKTAGFTDVAEKLTLLYDSTGAHSVPEVFNTKEAPIGFNDGEVYVFQY